MALNFKITEKVKNLVEEKHDFPVLTITPKTTEAKTVQKLQLNKEAVFQLNLKAGQYVGLAINSNRELVIVNLDNNEAQFSAKLNKDFSFNSKRIFNQLVKHFSLDPTIENELSLNCYKDEEDDYFCASFSSVMHSDEIISTMDYDEDPSLEYVVVEGLIN